MFTKEEFDFILAMLGKLQFGIGSGKQLTIAESIAKKIKEKND